MAQRPVWKLYLHYANETVEEFDGLNEEVGIDTLKYTFEMPLLVSKAFFIVMLTMNADDG